MEKILSNHEVIAAQIKTAEAINKGESSFEGFSELTRAVNKVAYKTAGQNVSKATDKYIKERIKARSKDTDLDDYKEQNQIFYEYLPISLSQSAGCTNEGWVHKSAKAMYEGYLIGFKHGRKSANLPKPEGIKSEMGITASADNQRVTEHKSTRAKIIEIARQAYINDRSSNTLDDVLAQEDSEKMGWIVDALIEHGFITEPKNPIE